MIFVVKVHLHILELYYTYILRDIKLPKISGEGQLDVNQWLRDFEDCDHTVKWNDLQKYIYSRQ